METSRKRVEQLCNRQFYDLIKSDARIRVHQGGTRSGKTYAIIQYLCYVLSTAPEPLVISIVRKTLPSLKGSVLRDFLKITQEIGIYQLGTYNKSSQEFYYNGHVVEFTSIDDPAKIRGRKRNIAFLNEANEFHLEDFRQINMRTTDYVIIDFNPSEPVHWLYSEVIERDDCDTWITTYNDNKFLSKELVFEIERMKERDPDYWRVYGEGQRAVFSQRQIFGNWTFIPEAEFPEFDDPVIGLDFGYSIDPSAAVLVQKHGDKLYIKELLYKKGLTNYDLQKFFSDQGLDQVLIFADSAEPKSIEELKQLGCWIKPATKGTGSINAGISLLKEFDVVVSKESTNLYTEYLNYYWTELKDGTIVNKPVDKFNHLMDALRYATYSQYSKRIDFFVI
jgi:phage terminase large subunit